MNPLRILKDVILAFHGGDDPRHWAAGFALGAALGLVPKGNLFALVFVLVFFTLRLNKGAALLAATAFTPLGYVVDGLAHSIGLALLKAGALRGLWTALYDLPIVPLTRFNNTVVLGNLALGLVLYAPLYFLGLRFISYYRANLAAKVEKLKLVQAFKGMGWYSSYQEWLG